jgi:hypothetical protein
MMDGWVIAAAFFAAGAFALGLLYEWRRWRSRPTWYWAADLATLRADPRCYRFRLQLVADQPALHVTVDGVGVDLDANVNDHAHGHQDPRGHDRWPHRGSVDPRDDPIEVFVAETGEVADPHLLVTWSVPPMRRERFLAQRIYVAEDAPVTQPYELRCGGGGGGGRVGRLDTRIATVTHLPT